MKYKRINLTIPQKIYSDWIQKFNEGNKNFDSFKYFVTIDGLNFGILFTSSLAYDYPVLLLRVYNTIRNNDFSGTGDTKLYSNGFKKVHDLMSIGIFVYNDVTYVLNLKFENLQSDKYLKCIKKFSTNPKFFEAYVYSIDIMDYNEILDICNCFLQVKFHKKYASNKKTTEYFKTKINALDFFLKKLSYYGFEITDYSSMSDFDYLKEIDRMITNTKKNIIQKEIEYLNYKFKNNDVLTDTIRRNILNKSKDLYDKYLSL